MEFCCPIPMEEVGSSAIFADFFVDTKLKLKSWGLLLEDVEITHTYSSPDIIT
jgi:hypothetical protein